MKSAAFFVDKLQVSWHASTKTNAFLDYWTLLYHSEKACLMLVLNSLESYKAVLENKTKPVQDLDSILRISKQNAGKPRQMESCVHHNRLFDLEQKTNC